MNILYTEQFQAYAKAHGHTCEEQLAIDKPKWGMAGFISWMLQARSSWAKQEGMVNNQLASWTEEQHNTFFSWLPTYSERLKETF